MGLELELLSGKLPPIRTAAAAATASPDGGGGDNAVLDGFSTPKLEASVLPPAPLVCPPAPRKPRPPAAAAKIRKLQRRGGHRCGSAAAPRPAAVRWLIAVPQDVLAAVFVARPGPAPPCPASSPASKKIRLHVVG